MMRGVGARGYPTFHRRLSGTGERGTGVGQQQPFILFYFILFYFSLYLRPDSRQAALLQAALLQAEA